MARISFRTEGFCRQIMVWKPGIKEILVCFIKGVQNKGIKVFCFKRADKIFSLRKRPRLEALRYRFCQDLCSCKIVEIVFFGTGIGNTDFFFLQTAH